MTDGLLGLPKDGLEVGVLGYRYSSFSQKERHVDVSKKMTTSQETRVGLSLRRNRHVSLSHGRLHDTMTVQVATHGVAVEKRK